MRDAGIYLLSDEHKRKKKRGVTKALDRTMAVQNLRDQGLYVLKIKENPEVEPWYKREIYIGAKVTARDFAVFSRQFATLIRADVTILESVRIMADHGGAGGV